MKYAVISDIHGDILALNIALNEIEKENVDKIICLGDTVGIGPYPNECVKRIMSLGDKLIAVRGNHEDRCIFGCPEFIHDDKKKLTEIELEREAWGRNQLDDESMSFITALPQSTIIEDNGYKIAVMHYPADENNLYKKFMFCFTRDECKEFFKEYNADICLFGHTHISFVSRPDGKWVINPGTLGLPGYKNYGTYGILEVNSDKIKYQEHDFKYDYNEVIRSMREINYPDVESMIRIFFGNR